LVDIGFGLRGISVSFDRVVPKKSARRYELDTSELRSAAEISPNYWDGATKVPESCTV